MMDINEELKGIVERARKNNHVDISNPDECRKCLEVNRDIILMGLEEDFYDFPIIFKEIGILNLTHYATILTKGDQTFLVDATYSQFFCDTILDDGSVILDLNNYLNSEEEQEFKDELVSNGFVLATRENIFSYVKGFVCALNDQGYNLDLETIYNNLIGSNNIFFEKNKTHI